MGRLARDGWGGGNFQISTANGKRPIDAVQRNRSAPAGNANLPIGAVGEGALFIHTLSPTPAHRAE